jgi:hypothetical protein
MSALQPIELKWYHVAIALFIFILAGARLKDALEA